MADANRLVHSTSAPVALGGSLHQSPSISALLNRPTFIEHKGYRFLIMDAPTESNLPAYIPLLKKKNVVAICRACEPTYKTELLNKNNIKVLDLPFPDGDPPPSDVVENWLDLVDACMEHNLAAIAKENGNGAEKKDKPKEGGGEEDDDKVTSGEPRNTVAVHCVAGLGRAPVLVAIALVESGMDPYDAIKYIRKKRRGAINARQLNFIEKYKPRSKDKKNKKGGKDKDCIVM